jgi:response regulator RpfG family c-di-GMP phosphodiesterase/PAS domain-containing protein
MKTVLLAYERDQDLAAVESVLQARGHRVLKARSGVDALDLVRNQTPDAIVSDVLLPRMDGFALCRRLREDPAFLHLPFLLHSFRVEGPKYEAFAAEVGAQRFFPRGSTLEELAAVLDEAPQGSGTMRMPALVPELLDRREQDRRRLSDLERQLKEAEAGNRALTAAERVARERAEYEARARAEFAAAESVRIRELQVRIRELEAAQRQAAEAESQARGAAEASQAEAARITALEARLNELQTARARAQSSANDAERAFAAQPTPTWIVDMESRLVHAATDSAAALVGLEPAVLRGKSLQELLPGVEFADESAREAIAHWRRQDGSESRLELRRIATSYAGRASWLLTARDVTSEFAAHAREQELSAQAEALDAAPEACGIVDGEGRLRYGNRALLALLNVDRDQLGTLTLQSLELTDTADATIRSINRTQSGALRDGARWRRPDGVVLDVEVALAAAREDAAFRVVTVRDVSVARRAAERGERDQFRVSRLLELTQRAGALTETEILERTLQLGRELTRSPQGYLFLAIGDATALEIVARHGGESVEPLTTLTRWRGPPPADTALGESVAAQRPVIRDGSEGTGALRQAGLPGSLHRQLVVPMLDGGRLVGVLLLADAERPYDDDDRRHVEHLADAAGKLLRRRRSDAEVVSAMDHMERVMFGAIESLAQLAEAQDACKTGRSKRVAEYAAGIGTALGLPGHTVRGLRIMGQLIDVGMLQIPRELLWRPGTLSASEFELVKTHAERGHEVLRHIEFPWPVAETVRQHHERLDGSGYPRGLKGEEILLEARIVAVADAVEAMLAQRPHRAALSVAACIEELQSQAGRRYDARVVKACVKLLRDAQPAQVPVPQEGEAPAGQRIA